MPKGKELSEDDLIAAILKVKPTANMPKRKKRKEATKGTPTAKRASKRS